MSTLIPRLSPILSNAVNSVQEKIVKTQTELATGINPNLSAASASVILSLSSDISTWNTRTTGLKTANELVGVTQTGLASISSILYQMLNLVNSAVADPDNATTYGSSYQSLGLQIKSIASSSLISGQTLLGLNPGIIIYPALSSNISSSIAGYDFTTLGTLLAADHDLSGSAAISTTTKLTHLNTYIDQVSALQSSMSAYSGAIEASITAAGGFSSGLNAYIDDLQNIDATALQGQLQVYNNQLSIDYYLVGQLNAAAAEELRIFR
jgi:flagellin-like hook-associated protein FlgL